MTDSAGSEPVCASSHPPLTKLEITQTRQAVELSLSEQVRALKQENEQLRRELAVSKHSEAGLRQTAQELQSILDHSPAIVYVKDSQGRFTYINRQFELLFHLTQEQIQGKSNHEVFPQDLADIFWENDRSVLVGGNAITLEEKALLDDGLHTYLSVKFPLLDENGHSYAVCGISTDVTGRKVAEEALRQSQDMLQLVIDNIPQRIFWKDKNLIYLGCNRKQAEAARLTSPQEIIGKTDYDLPLSTEEAEFFRECDRQVMLTNIPAYHIVKSRIQADGQQIWQDTNKIPLHDSEGNVVGVLGTVEDITERKQVEVQLKQQSDELEYAFQELQHTQMQLVQSEKMSSLGQLVAGVAHEINNPVNFIYGNLTHANEYIQDLLSLIELYQQSYPNTVPAIAAAAQAIDLDFLKEDLPKLLSSMKVGADRIQKIVASLRTFSRMDEADMKAVDIHEGIESTLMILQGRLKVKPERCGIELVKNYGNLPLVECYGGQLNQVFMNILSNAIDALEDGLSQQPSLQPRITVSTELLPSDQVLISIANNGPKIPDSSQSRLFEPFFTTKPIGKGTGMGLAISYQIVTEKHQGTLTCSSDAKHGTVFKIQIPLSQSH